MASPFVPLASVARVRAAFVPRVDGVDVAVDRATALDRLRAPHEEFLRARGFDPARLATAEQVHGNGVAFAEAPGPHAGVDGIATDVPGLALGIYVADCAAVYLADRRGRGIALVHSGRAGTEANIVGRAISLLRERCGIDPSELAVEISPCIRPPLYETDFAAAIARQAREAGVSDVRDEGVCTGKNVGAYYSYRVEKGRTGRMLAVAMLEGR